MQRFARTWMIFFLLILSLGPSMGRAQPAVPDALEGWQDWVLHDREWVRCPARADATWMEPGAHQCVWPGPMTLALTPDAGIFEVRVRVYSESAVPLPGAPGAWPLEVTSDGRRVPVTDRDGVPVVRLPAGEHVLRGRLEWVQRPQQLPVPSTYGLLRLNLDGRDVAHPPLRGHVLWLAEDRTQAAPAEAESLTVWVGRRVIDSVPTTVETVLELAVSGPPREIQLPGVLLEGTTPVTLHTEDQGDGTLPVQLQADGSLRAQVRSGFYRVHLLSRAPGVLESLAAPDNTPASEQREIWAFDSQPHLRVAVAEGPAQADPSQSPLEIGREAWSNLPQYLLAPGERIALVERSRGLRPEEGNRLVLDRTWWLDFDGEGLHARDAVSGQMRHGWRLDLAPPYALKSARDRERDAQLLVTAPRGSESAGIEVRDPSPSLLTHARLAPDGALPVTGWSEAMDEVHGTLVLPPGWKLWGAPGAETAQGTWWARWTLLDLFLVLITTVLLYRLLGWRGAAVGGLLLALAWHEADGVFLPLLAVLLLVLAHQALPEGSVRRVTGVVRNVLALVLALGAVLFAAEQARLALYPQLGGFPVFGAASAPASVMAPAPPPEAPQSADELQITQYKVDRAELERDAAEPMLDKVRVTGSRISLYELVSLVPEDARLQAGPGEPQWRWTTHRLHWSGPVLPDESFRLLLSPPWLTSAVRWLSIGLLGWLLWLLSGFFRPGRANPGRASATHAAVLAAGLCALMALPAAADTTPDPKLLDELRQRLLEGPECADHCAALGAVRLQVGPETLVIEQEWHLQAALAVPLVHEAQAQWMPSSVRVDGAPADYLAGLGQPMLVLQPGVHTVRLEGTLSGLDGLRLRFPMGPHAVRVQADGWTVAGIGRGQLLGREVQLARQPSADDATAGDVEDAALSQGPLPPFGEVERSFWLDREWELRTTVSRWDEGQGVVTLRVPLFPGEQVLDESLVVEDGMALVTLSADAEQVFWNSRIEPASELVLQAPEFDQYAETWGFTVSPIWRAAFEGLPQSQPMVISDFWGFDFDPRPGETLAVAVARPAAVEGATLAIDEVNVRERIGRRQRDVSLHAALRSTLGTEHRVRLPTDATVRSVSMDGRTLYLQPVDGVLSLPVTPGEHRLALELTRPHGSALTVRATPFDLEADSANITRVVELPADRWILAAWGPGIGPAILYWSVLAVVLLAAWVLSRVPLTPLKFQHWVLLGIGFSLFAWPVMVLVAAWLLTLGAVAKRPPPRRDDLFNLRQVALVVFSGVVLLSLVGAIPGSLLSRPDMQIAGPGSAGTVLQWFVDRSDGSVPVQHVLSLPMWAYKVVILAWALWLSLALVRWIRWAWEAVSAHGLWRGKVKKQAESA